MKLELTIYTAGEFRATARFLDAMAAERTSTEDMKNQIEEAHEVLDEAVVEAEPTAPAEEQPAEKFVTNTPRVGEPNDPRRESAKPRGRPRKEQPSPVAVNENANEVTVQDVVAAEVEVLPPEPKKEYTRDDVRSAAQAYLAHHSSGNAGGNEAGREKLFKLLQKYGTTKVKDFPLEKAEAFLADAAVV